MILPLAVAALDSVTVVSRAEPGWLWGLEGIIAVIVAVLLIVLLTSYIVLGVMLKRAFDRMNAAVERFRADIRPVTQRAAEIAEHLEEAASNVNDAVGDVADARHVLERDRLVGEERGGDDRQRRVLVPRRPDAPLQPVRSFDDELRRSHVDDGGRMREMSTGAGG